MIDMTMEDFLLWAAGAPLVGIAVVTVVGRMRKRARKRALRREIVECRICGHLYKDATRDRLPGCPECGSANERGAPRRLG